MTKEEIAKVFLSLIISNGFPHINANSSWKNWKNLIKTMLDWKIENARQGYGSAHMLSTWLYLPY